MGAERVLVAQVVLRAAVVTLAEHLDRGDVGEIWGRYREVLRRYNGHIGEMLGRCR